MKYRIRKGTQVIRIDYVKGWSAPIRIDEDMIFTEADVMEPSKEDQMRFRLRFDIHDWSMLEVYSNEVEKI